MAVSTVWSNTVPRAKVDLIDQVATTYGNNGDTELEAACLKDLNAAIDDINTHLWEFNKCAETGIVMTPGQAWVTLPAPVYREVAAFIVNTNSGQSYPHLAYMSWIDFQRTYGIPNDHGQPAVYSIFNPHRDGRLYLAPAPPDSTSSFTTDNTLTFEYYRRIPHVDEEDPLQIPREIESLIVYGAQKRTAIRMVGPSSPDVASFASLEGQALDRLRAIDRRNPDERLRFKLVDTVNNGRVLPRNYLVIKI